MILKQCKSFPMIIPVKVCVDFTALFKMFFHLMVFDQGLGLLDLDLATGDLKWQKRSRSLLSISENEFRKVSSASCQCI